MPRMPKRPLSYGSTISTSAKIAAAPSASAPRNVASQRPQAVASTSATSELEIDELIGVLIAQFDEQRNCDNTERCRDHGSRPLVEPRDDLLTCREQERGQRRHDDRSCAIEPIGIRQDGKAL